MQINVIIIIILNFKLKWLQVTVLLENIKLRMYSIASNKPFVN